MSTEPLGNTPGPPAAPPTELVRVPTPEKVSSWPTVIGIIAITLGGLGTLSGLWGALSPIYMRAMSAAMPTSQRAAFDLMQNWQTWTVVASLLGTVLAVVLLVAGIGLLKRAAWARPTCQIWAVLKMLLAVATAVVGSLIQRDMLSAMSRMDPNMPALPAGFAEGAASVGLVFALAWGWALPVFLLVWFARGKIKAEIAEWA